MKRTYKLLGVEWDHEPLPSSCPVFTKEGDAPNWREERTIFDIAEYCREICISELLSLKKKDIARIIEKIRECDRVYIVLDYEPGTEGEIAMAFYVLRFLQIFGYLQRQLPETKMQVIGSPRIRTKCERRMGNQKSVEKAIKT